MVNEFHGWAGYSPSSVKGELKWEKFEPKTLRDDDVELKILYCGICSSDLHTLSGNWQGDSQDYPQVVGHEIIGEVVTAGPKSGHKVGDIVGVGPICDTCQECRWCTGGLGNLCAKGMVGTYDGKFYRGPSKGEKSFGGYADYWRGPGWWCIEIPSGVDLAATAPLLCAGVTVYYPLEKYGAGTTAPSVGVVGLGGLGHIALMLAKAMGAEVTVISRSDSKKEDATEMGADHFVAMGKDNSGGKGHERTLDLIVCTIYDKDFDASPYLKLLNPGGTFAMVGVSGAEHIKLNAGQLLMNNYNFTSSPAGSPECSARMLKLVAEKGVKPWVKVWPMEKANEAVQSMDKGEARYRHVLANTQHGAKL